MQHLSTAFLIVALVIAVNQGSATSQDDSPADQIADETKNRAVTIVDGPKYVETHTQPSRPANQTQPDQRPPSKPPHPAPDKTTHNYVKQPLRSYQPIRPSYRLAYKKSFAPPAYRQSTEQYRVIPLSTHRKKTYQLTYQNKPSTRQPLVFAASTGRPVRVPLQPPKFSVPIETINGIRADEVRPPKGYERNTTTSTTTSTTTTTTTTTQRPLRNKRIWPKNIERKQYIVHNVTKGNTSTGNGTSTNSTDLETASATHLRFRFFTNSNKTALMTTTFVPLTVTRGYRKVTRVPNHTTTTTPANTNFTRIQANEWVPIIPSHYHNPHTKRRRPIKKLLISNRRSDGGDVEFTGPEDTAEETKRTVYLQPFGLVPVGGQPQALGGRKKMVIFRKRKRPISMSVFPSSQKPTGVRALAQLSDGPDLQFEGSRHPRIITRIKHHHHHHHHRYIKTVEKPIKVPFKVEVPKPYPVTIEKKVPVAVEKIKIVEKPVPYPVQVEKKVPYPVQVAVPHPVPYKVIEKEYVPKPYPVYHQVPVVRHVEVKVPHPVPVQVEKRVPYPVEVQVPVPVYHPYPVNVTIEKKVPYPVPVRVLVPQPYPVETRVAYPVEVKVKEPVEVVKHVPVKVPVPQPYPVRVPTPIAVTVEKRVPYPIEVEKKVPVPYIVNQKVEVEKRVPVYVPQPYPVEKKVPVPVKVPYPVYTQGPVFNNQPYQYNYIGHQSAVSEAPYSYSTYTSSNEVTSTPHHTVTVHGNTGFAGFQSRSDKTETTSAESSESTESTGATTTIKYDSVTASSVPSATNNTMYASSTEFDYSVYETK